MVEPGRALDVPCLLILGEHEKHPVRPEPRPPGVLPVRGEAEARRVERHRPREVRDRQVHGAYRGGGVDHRLMVHRRLISVGIDRSLHGHYPGGAIRLPCKFHTTCLSSS